MNLDVEKDLETSWQAAAGGTAGDRGALSVADVGGPVSPCLLNEPRLLCWSASLSSSLPGRQPPVLSGPLRVPKCLLN